MPRPIIAVTATTRRETAADPTRLRLNAAYVDAVTRAGGIAVVVPQLDPAAAPEALAVARALLVTGGEDIDPALYGAAPAAKLGRVTAGRDAWEIALVRAARDMRIPVLGVCRGIQVVNVALGGTLIQDIPSERPGALEHEQTSGRTARTHAVTLGAGSLLASIMGASADVNSMHHQAVDRAGTGLAVTAIAPDGIIEGIEWSEAGWWAVGVQWHPEELDGVDAGLFSGLVDAAR